MGAATKAMIPQDKITLGARVIGPAAKENEVWEIIETSPRYVKIRVTTPRGTFYLDRTRGVVSEHYSLETPNH